MNALELADELRKALNNNKKHSDLDAKAIIMLRQQQAEIEELKDELMLAKQSLEIIKGYVK